MNEYELLFSSFCTRAYIYIDSLRVLYLGGDDLCTAMHLQGNVLGKTQPGVCSFPSHPSAVVDLGWI